MSVDMLTSPTPGMIAQMTGKLTSARYRYATVYVDSASSLGYVQFQRDATADETIKGKRAFETYANQNGVSIRRYHADNGIFRAHKWVESCQQAKQALTFAAVNEEICVIFEKKVTMMLQQQCFSN